MLSRPSDHMYYFEGKDYSKDPSAEDQKSFDRLLEEQLAEFQRAAGEGRALRHKTGVRVCLIDCISYGRSICDIGLWTAVLKPRVWILAVAILFFWSQK